MSSTNTSDLRTVDTSGSRDLLSKICVLYRPLLLQEQTIFTQEQFRLHLEEGESDESENLLIYHPLCDFCNQHYFNLDAFRIHLKRDHEQCELCKPNFPHIYYENFNQLADHFDEIHYRCKEPKCLEINPFLVYQTQAELNLHMEKVHWRTGKSKNGKVKFNVTSLLGISCEEQTGSDDEEDQKTSEMEFFEDWDYQSFMNLVETMRSQGNEITDEQAEDMFENLRKNQEEKHIKKLQQKQKIIDHIGKDFTQVVISTNPVQKSRRRLYRSATTSSQLRGRLRRHQIFHDGQRKQNKQYPTSLS